MSDVGSPPFACSASPFFARSDSPFADDTGLESPFFAPVGAPFVDGSDADSPFVDDSPFAAAPPVARAGQIERELGLVGVGVELVAIAVAVAVGTVVDFAPVDPLGIVSHRPAPPRCRRRRA
ncbi:hypothetical protein [Salinigranum sp. GCM10025319]|uniref:hypothetical protein n=1 Tax=Salinigranum sp. GCM10025319 TaxID=3252687 RepID=UPI00360C61F8